MGSLNNSPGGRGPVELVPGASLISGVIPKLIRVPQLNLNPQTRVILVPTFNLKPTYIPTPPS